MKFYVQHLPLAIVHLSLGANPIKADDHLLDVMDTAVGQARLTHSQLL